jgi:hypothetical protein
VKTVIGLFDDMAQAKNASLDLEKAGITHNDISIVANNQSGTYAPYDSNSTTDSGVSTTGHAIGRDATVGAEIGGVAGLLMGLTAFAIPGFGWIAGAGWFWGTIMGAATGAVIGGLVGALTNVGVPAEEAGYYTEGVRRGGILVVVRADEMMAQQVASILNSDGAVNIQERAAQYRNEGFDYNAPIQPMDTNTTNTTSYNSGQPVVR